MAALNLASQAGSARKAVDMAIEIWQLTRVEAVVARISEMEKGAKDLSK